MTLRREFYESLCEKLVDDRVSMTTSEVDILLLKMYQNDVVSVNHHILRASSSSKPLQGIQFLIAHCSPEAFDAIRVSIKEWDPTDLMTFALEWLQDYRKSGRDPGP